MEHPNLTPNREMLFLECVRLENLCKQMSAECNREHPDMNAILHILSGLRIGAGQLHVELLNWRRQ